MKTFVVVFAYVLDFTMGYAFGTLIAVWMQEALSLKGRH